MLKKSEFLEKYSKSAKKGFTKHGLRNILLFLFSCLIILVGLTLVWASTLQIPSIDTIESNRISQSTKIYDSTGKILLYDAAQTTKRTVIPFDQISQHVKDATLSIEDKDFYTEGGVRFTSYLRALLADITSFSLSQGGSTITQQVVKNTVLNGDKTPTRKLKEFVLSIKLDQTMTKDEIFNIYLNEIPYGGNLYGVEEASEAFFGISASDLDIAQSAYLASLPQAPTYYSPYGPNTAALETRKNLVLKEMLDNKKITQDEYNSALTEKVTFLPKSDNSIKAPHFVMYVEQYLEQKYGSDVLETGGLKVITTLNYDLESKAETVAKTYSVQNEKTFNGSNDAFVAIDPTTGAILTMVGSRDYFDTQIDGQFNVATAHRQPGSAFKPFVYSEAFIKGYTPDTVLFDVPTQFNASCAVNDFTTSSTTGCYAPVNYDGKFRGPMTLRDALAQSINVPSVKLMYLVGVQDSINLAESMGVQSLGDANQYGLTLVLGGGEVSLLDMTSAYGVFATEGIRNPYYSVQEIDDATGKVLEKHQPEPTQVLDPEITREISDILSDNVARAPDYGLDSPLYFSNQDVAVKTGTTNDYRDAWILGYTPNLVLGAWVGNNDNTPMDKKIAGFIVAPMWRALMDQILPEFPVQNFNKPQPDDSYMLKPVLRGKWQGGISSITQNPNADPNVPYNSVSETLSGGVHSILYWVDKDDPLGPPPADPNADPQFKSWEYGVRLWAAQNGYQ
jgi:penicillin-binding protein 1C